MNILSYIGNTPIVKLLSIDPNMADIYVKLESFNPGGSIKSRVGFQMIQDAEDSGRLSPGSTIIEATGGNTGVGLAISANLKGLKFTAVVPDNYSKKRIELLKIYGANVVLSDSSKGGDSHIKLVEQMIKADSNYVWLNQFINRSSIKAHYTKTGPEIGKMIIPDAFVAAVGSGGTLQGTGSFLKTLNKNIKIFVAQPSGCDLSNGTAIKHKVQGVSLGIIPGLVDFSLIDDYIDIGFEDIVNILRRIVKTDSMFVGISAGLNIAAAIEVAKKLGKGKKVVTVAPDGGEMYMDEGIYGG